MSQLPIERNKIRKDPSKQSIRNRWGNCRIAITGASGSFGKALTRKLRAKGAFIIGLTHKEGLNNQKSKEGPNEWVCWQCGQEKSLKGTLEKIDILVLNHGINPKGLQSSEDLSQALEINALSTWRLIKIFESIVQKNDYSSKPREVWVNTSEAEVQPTLSPGYEISKRLIGELVSLNWNNQSKEMKKNLTIRKLILGPFYSQLNPIGIMNAQFVASQVILQIEIGLTLVIVTPNPITYISIPINEFLRFIYSKLSSNYS